MATDGPKSDITKQSKQWGDFCEDVVIVVKRLETFEHKRLKLSTMNTIGDMKDMITDVYGDERGDQKLTYGTEVLANDSNTIGLHGIADASMIYLTTRRSTGGCRNKRLIITSTSSCFMVMWRRGDTVDFVRDKIATKTTLHKDEIAIFSKLELMDPIRSLESYHLEHDSRVEFEIKALPPLCQRELTTTMTMSEPSCRIVIWYWCVICSLASVWDPSDGRSC